MNEIQFENVRMNLIQIEKKWTFENRF